MTGKAAKQKTVKAITDGKTLVYLVRHGETTWNAEHRFQGHLDVELSRKGLAQAEAVAKWLATQPVHFAALFSSDLKRAVQTAQIIGKRVGLIPQLYRGLRELHGGEWQGLLRAEIEARFPGKLDLWDEQLDSFTVPGGESLPAVQRRIYATYEKIVAEHTGEAIIIVSHGAALTTLLAALHDWDLVETWQTRQARMGNTGVTVVAHDHHTDSHDLLLLNSSEHLTEEGAAGGAPTPGRDL
ncbi:MAG TPA: histidine phosphatase family protein [Chloroflexia bacterium]|nr:histidine phosphatase family protein [Chloroflexia bacterium]